MKQRTKDLIEIILYILATISIIVFFTIASVKELQTDTKVSETLKEPYRALNVAQNDSFEAGYYRLKSLTANDVYFHNVNDSTLNDYFDFHKSSSVGNVTIYQSLEIEALNRGSNVENIIGIGFVFVRSYTSTTYDNIYFNRAYLENESHEQINIVSYDTSWDTPAFPSGDILLNLKVLGAFSGNTTYIAPKSSASLINYLFNYVYPSDSADFVNYDLSNYNPAFLISRVVSPNQVFICPFGQGWQGGGSISIKLDFLFLNAGYLCDRLYIVYDLMYFTADNNGNITKWDNAEYNGTGNLPYFAFTKLMVHRVTEQSENNDIVHTIASKPIMTYQQYEQLTYYQPVYMLGQPLNFSSADFKTITFLNSYLSQNVTQPIGNYDFPAKNLSLYEVLNIKGDYVYNSTGSTDAGLGNVFVLIGTAFTSFLPIFNISVIPGVTIGLLFFMPLIVTIIIVIIRLVKR